MPGGSAPHGIHNRDLMLDLSFQHVMKFLFDRNKRLVFFGIRKHGGMAQLPVGTLLFGAPDSRRRPHPGRYRSWREGAYRHGLRIDYRAHLTTDGGHLRPAPAGLHYPYGRASHGDRQRPGPAVNSRRGPLFYAHIMLADGDTVVGGRLFPETLAAEAECVVNELRGPVTFRTYDPRTGQLVLAFQENAPQDKPS